MDPSGLSVTEAGEVLGFARYTLSRVLNGHSDDYRNGHSNAYANRDGHTDGYRTGHAYAYTDTRAGADAHIYVHFHTYARCNIHPRSGTGIHTYAGSNSGARRRTAGMGHRPANCDTRDVGRRSDIRRLAKTARPTLRRREPVQIGVAAQ